MASNSSSANNGNEAGANQLPPVPPTSTALGGGATNGGPDDAATSSGSASDMNTIPEPTTASQPSFPGFLHVQDDHQDVTIDLQTGVVTYRPLEGRNRHRDPFCDLPHLLGRQDIESQRNLYALLLLAGPGNWHNTVQLYNYLFHRTSDIITHDGTLVTPAPPMPALATKAGIKVMLEDQDFYPIDQAGVFIYMNGLKAMNKPFIGQGRQQGMRYELGDVIAMLRGWYVEAGIQIARNPGVEQGGTQ